MGAVFNPKDLARRDKRIIIEDAIRDLAPETKENIRALLNSWEGQRSEERLKDIVGDDRTESIIRQLKRSDKQK